MKINITKRVNPNYGKKRTVKIFALFPRWLDYGTETYFVWLEYFYQDEHYRFDAGTGRDDWYIDSNYPILPGVEPTYKTPTP